ncbi:MAG: hypothetical protein HQL83_16275 [Magnetococcales bacterium]|nr:hypothetical protein [Magnetococcales bacterium]MBF0632833.1 hypothetical protein [Magnetococcales bacterium]
MYQAPQPEHPETMQDIRDQDLHANHLEGQNAATRRRSSAFRRRTNTYSKTTEGLQRTLDVHLINHNFVRRHWTTGEVPAVKSGLQKAPLTVEAILRMRKAA